MQNSSQPKLLPVPFADTGSKQNIPNDSQVGIAAGRASYADGFPPLTRTPLAAGGVPPFGTDFNGVLNDITAALRWSQSGAGYPFNAAFNTAISGYPKGARIPNSTLDGYWLNTIDGNTSNPEVTGAATTGWVPAESYGVTAITGLSGSSVTLSTLQASKDRITLAGTLSANINLVLPAWNKSWTVVNNCTGAFSVTVKTPTGSGVVLPAGKSGVLVGDGTNITQDSLPPNFIRFASGGAFTVPQGVYTIYLSGCAAGGGGASGATNNGGQSSLVGGGGGGGGGAGQSIIKQAYSVTPGQSLTVTIGSGGNGAQASASGGGYSGNSGGNTSVSGLVTLTGGTGGYAGGVVGNNAAGGGGAGGYGGEGYPAGSSGSDGNYAGNGGAGASSMFGAGGGGSRAIKTNPTDSRLSGQPAYGYGSGGGGSGGAYGSSSAVVTYAAGNGAPGIMIVEW